MSGTIRVTHTRTTVRGISREEKVAHLEETQFMGTGPSTDDAVADLMRTIGSYGWSPDRDQYQILEGHGHPAL